MATPKPLILRRLMTHCRRLGDFPWHHSVTTVRTAHVDRMRCEDIVIQLGENTLSRDSPGEPVVVVKGGMDKVLKWRAAVYVRYEP